MERKQSIFFSLNDRTFGYRYRTNLQRNVLGSEYLIRRLKCEHVFVGHEGCVNTVAWNECGSILLSGSDDCKLNIYKLSSMKPMQSIQSGHQANIFSAKFLPCTSDTKIASCSGDGILQYNDVNSHLYYGKNSFRCHTGTTYEVNTTPGDPHTFMSSGEDGTVRLFDLRSKTKCSCEGCKEDVLIDCEKAVTSFSVNPVQPYYVAIGCESSLLRVYDRRSLSTGDPGKEPDKQRGLLHQFKPKALENRDCRVTSLKYSSDGRNLLASYCSDYVYLFDSNPKPIDQFRSGTGVDKPNEPCPNAGNDSPMKRLRLRGDWSDTGPNARPEGEEPGTTTEDNFVQRMSGYLTRWIEESLRNARRQRRQNPNASREHPEEDPEQSDESSNSESVEDVSTLPLSEEELEQQRTGTNAYSDVSENSNDVTENSDDVTQETDHALSMSRTLPRDINETSQTTKSTETDHVQHACASRDSRMASRSRDHDNVANSNSTETNIQNGTKSKNFVTTRLRKRKCSSDKVSTDDDECRSVSCGEMTSDDSHGNEACKSNHSDEKCDHELNYEKMKKQTEVSKLETNILESEEIVRGTKTPECDIPPVINNRGLLPNRTLDFDAGVLSPEIPDSETGTTESEILNCFVDESLMVDSSSQDSRRRDFENLESQTLASHSKRQIPDGKNNVANEVSGTSLSSRGNVPSENVPSENVPSRNEPSENLRSESETSDLWNSSTSGISTRITIPLGTDASESKFPVVVSETGSSETASGSHDRNVGETSRSEDDDTRRDAAASTIQNFFRFRVKKEFKSIPCDVHVHADANQVFKGHRNARTMIKEANFWGDDYVLSGSDCGRIFIWSRKTAKVVMLLEGDRHVVNCIQPHPSFPILATSGIDYDIKLWTPTALNACSLENAQEVIARNERMLSENRDTLTVPASFMIRVLSSLHRVRFNGRDDNQSSGDSDSDVEEDC